MSDGDDDNRLHELRINNDFAADYLMTKRQQLAKSKAGREVLQAVAHDSDQSSSSASSSEDEDPDGLLLTPNLDQQIMTTIDRIRQRDPSVYDPNTKFYSDGDDDRGDLVEQRSAEPEIIAKGSTSKKSKSVRQILAEQMIEEALNPDVDPDTVATRFVPVNEQALARQAFLSADFNASESDDDELELIPRPKVADDSPDANEYARFQAAQDRHRSQQAAPTNVLGRYAVADGLSADDQFLKEYVAGEWWKEQRPAGYIDRGLIATIRPNQVAGQHSPTADSDEAAADLSADEAFLEAQDQFEAQYNFRFEEPGGARLVTHPRRIEESARREDDRRARRREKRKAAKKAAKERQAEELRRAKNVRKQELLEQAEMEELHKVQEMRQKQVQERLEAVSEFAGVEIDDDDKRAKLLSQLDLDGEFDAADYDRKMAAVFDDEFYENDDNIGYESLVKSVSKLNKSDDDTDHESVVVKASKPNKKKRPRISSDKTHQILDELYAMDFEDTIAGGDVRARFRYTQVPSHSFGMSVEDILSADDKELQKRVSIKQLAPYRTDRNLKGTWQQLHKERGARFRRKQARAVKQPQNPS